MKESRQLPRLICIGEYKLDTRAGELRKGGATLLLHGQPLQILLLLLEQPGEVVTREELRTALWSSHTFVDFQDSLNHAVGRLREALGDSAENPRFIETVARRGYRFIGALDEIEQGPQDQKTATKTVAVLPLENLTGDPAEGYFVDGMTDELIGTLAKIGSLQVVSRSSVMTYKGASKTLPQIARELNADALVEGTVARSGNRVRISARLVDAETDRHLWAETYEGELRDILALQSGIARAIAAAVEVKLTPPQEAALATAPTVNPAANEAYLKGRYCWRKTTANGLSTAIKYFRQAVDKEPRYALADSGLADAYASIGLWGFGPHSPQKAMQKAKQAAVRALQISDQLAEAHTALARVSFYHDWDFSGAEREYQRAIELNQNYPAAHAGYSMYLILMGRVEESLTEMQRAYALDPSSLLLNATGGERLYLARQYEAALEQLRKALEMEPNFFLTHIFLGLACEQVRKCEEAIAEFENALSLSGESPIAVATLAHAYAIAGRKRQAQNVLGDLENSLKNGRVPTYHMAAIYAALGDNDKAFDWLEKAYEERSLWMVHLKVAPKLDPLRSDPRFHDLLRRMNFPP
jgi:TolB-like protein/Flp pilus assembly protein TadD